MNNIRRLNTINMNLEGRSDLKVPFIRKRFVIHGLTVEGVFPVFQGIEVKLNDYYMTDKFWADNANSDIKCYREQMKAASKSLYQLLQCNPSLVRNFNEDQLNAIAKGSDNIPGYTWHHKEDWLVMQLVVTEIHQLYKHTGGSYTWNKNNLE